MKQTIREHSELQRKLIAAKQCTTSTCNQIALKKRKTPPATASEHAKYFDYWQCPKCKTTTAYKKNQRRLRP